MVATEALKTLKDNKNYIMDSLEYPKLYSTFSNCIHINNNPFTIGRGLNCDYIIANQVISRLHCQLEKNGNQWFLRDSSTNGTYVNNRIVKNELSLPLKDSDVIQLSQDNFKYNFQCTSREDISDEQLCMIADSVLENIVVPTPNSSVPSTSTSNNISISDSISEDVISVQESDSLSIVSAQPNKRIKVSHPAVIDLTEDSFSIQNDIPSTSSTNPRPVINVSDNFQVSATSDLKMVIQKVSKNATNVETEKASTSTTTTIMGQTESQRPEEKECNDMDDELLCAICSEMFVKASTLNCSHTFCKFCIDTWKKKQVVCPICRTKITSQVGTLVLDNVIEKVVQSSSREVQDRRKELLEERSNMHEEKTACKRRPAPVHVVEEDSTETEVVDSSSSDTSTVSEISDLDVSIGEDWEAEYWNDDWYDRRGGAYYGGYGHCFACGRRGHWANGCPFR